MRLHSVTCTSAVCLGRLTYLRVSEKQRLKCVSRYRISLNLIHRNVGFTQNTDMLLTASALMSGDPLKQPTPFLVGITRQHEMKRRAQPIAATIRCGCSENSAATVDLYTPISGEEPRRTSRGEASLESSLLRDGGKHDTNLSDSINLQGMLWSLASGHPRLMWIFILLSQIKSRQKSKWKSKMDFRIANTSTNSFAIPSRNEWKI